MTSAGSNRGRVRARRCAVQALYQWIVTQAAPTDILTEFVTEREVVKVDLDYFSELIREIPRHYKGLREDITVAIDRDWSQIDPVAQAVLLLGTYELRYCPQVPWRVVVNEAVDLCKMFGAEDAHKYVNGVLDKIARESRHVEIAGSPTPSTSV